MKKTLFLVILPLFFISFSNAQEICNDGIDNDGDGFIDCFDGDCISDAACDGFYMGNDASCVAEPSIFPQFTLSLGYQSNNNASLNLSRIAIGDLDRDGIPDILSTNRNDDRIFLLNGDDATIKHQATTNNPSFRSAAMANLQDDNCGEVFIINENSGSDYRIRSFDCELNELWVSERFNQDPVFVSFADFDRDGQAEMYYKDEIRDPVTGTRIVASTTGNWNNIPSGGVAVDIVGDADLELVLGNRIYAVELNGRTQDVGTLTLLATMPSAYQTKNNSFASAQSSTTSIADYNLDGNLDVIITGANGGNVSSVFFWDVINNTAKVFNDPIGTGTYQFGWQRGMGRVNIADLDGDGQLNAAFVSGQFLYALDENWEPLWVDAFGDPAPVVVNEETSGITGATLFDFNGDGKSEIVYRDEDYLYIMNGNDGSVNTQIHCRSRTSVEYPIVADVDADGSTEICVTCASENHLPGTPGRNLDLSTPAEVRVYKSGGEPWVPSRKVWNQHGYFNVNINDDLTVPQNQQKHQLVFSDGVCTSGPNRPLNNFLNQAPLLTSDGCYAYSAPELNLIEPSLAINSSSCSSQDFTVSFEFENNGDVAISGQIPVTFYDGDPLVADANKLNTELITLSNFSVGETFTAENISVNGQAENFTLYAALNDNGSTTPSPISFPTTNFLECDYSNNIALLEVSGQTITSITQSETIISLPTSCSESNGQLEVEAVSSDNTSGFNFKWFQGSAATGTPFFTESGVNISQAINLTSGLYTVVATDIDNGCVNEAVFNLPFADSQEIDITSITNITSCDGQTDGEITMELNPVSLPDVDESNYIIRLYEGSDVSSYPIAAKNGIASQSSYTFSGLSEGDYTIETIGDESLDSCSVYSFVGVEDNTPPDLKLSRGFFLTPPNCPDEQFAVSFDFKNIGGAPFSGDVPITFYDGDPLIAGTNKLNTELVTISNLDVDQVASAVDLSVNGSGGNFTLYVVLNDNGSTTPTPISFPNSNFLECDYTNNISSVGIYPIPFALSTEKTNNITCSSDGSSLAPNGSARVFRLVSGAEVTADYDFFWFNGTTVDGPPDYTGAVYTGLSAGTYTVFAKDKLAGCSSDTIQVVIDDTAENLEAAITVDNGNSNCLNPNGQLTISINGGEPVGNFDYEWYEGNTVGGGLQISNSHIANNLESATYTVLVTEKATGCQTIESAQVPEETATPVVTATATDIACSDTGTGIVSASVGGETTGYTFEWYIGNSEKPTADYTTSTVNNLPPGSYTVKATNDVSGCESALVTVVVEQTLSPEIAATTSTENNSCDPSQPNGTVTVSIVGEASEHTVEWFAGVGATGPVISDSLALSSLGAGEYTVKVTYDDTGCFITDRVTVINNIVQPNLTASASPVNYCSPFNGRIAANVDLDSESDYTFYWYEGTTVKDSTDFSEAGNVLAELEAGFYTVQAFHNTHNCLTDPVTIEVVNEATFSASILTTVNEDYGSVANGSISIGVDKADRTYEVFLNQQAYKIFNTGLSELEITNLTAGVYEIKVIDTTSACSVNLSIEIFTNPNTSTDILSFSLPNSTSAAVIDTTKHTVEIEVEGLTDITSVVPEIEISEEASISPNMEEARDFTEIVVYTVTAGDSTTLQNWEVTVTKAPILKEDQTITFNLPDTLNQDQSPYPLEASSSSGLPVRFSVESGSASILNGQLVLTRESEVTIKAYQAGNDTLNYAEVERTVTVLGSYDISVDILRPDDSALEEGLAKLFLKNGGMFQRKKFSNGDLEFTNVRAGEYILQIIPLGSATSDVFPTYYANTHFHKDASVLRVDNDMSLKVYMKEKTSASNDNGNGRINGRVVKSEDSSNERITLGKATGGEGIGELIVYLLNESTGGVSGVAVTDELGDFNMAEIPEGDYNLLLDIPGLEQEATSFELPYDKQNSEISLVIYLNESGVVNFDINTVLGNDDAEIDFNLYPNPTNGELNLNGYTGTEQEVSVISANGAVVKTLKLSTARRQKIDLTDLKEGVYYLRFDSGKQSMVKIIKN
ncbi:Por secretion system C-terminal sorting domain-containing protein [Marivirga sericea]|uniref:Por secretion system C-terminal sorting domain-containing protein n=1 Tax=Marivirga sericea TaxID=1028 RepID=A0A1X7JMG4_9BACT|nr:T9SS type A sorting domain-containing protein [Marivirga sericea]SMG29110.1 Por secretion system C-terminal sorting domain-containing protein [Marivirga sericea]